MKRKSKCEACHLLEDRAGKRQCLRYGKPCAAVAGNCRLSGNVTRNNRRAAR
jgi:hypothetical protein